MSCNSNIIDALPKTLHWLIRPGSSSFDFTFQVLESGAPIDISAYDFTVTIRRPNGTEVLSLGMGDGITLVSSTRGRATLSTGDSATLPQDLDLLWSFDMTTPTDEEYPMLGGRLVVTARTTACVQVPGDTDFTFTAAPAALDFSFSQSLPATWYTELAVEPGDTYTIPAGKTLFSIAIDPDDTDRTISIGYAANGTQVLDAEEIPADESYSTILGRYYYTSQTLHFSAFTGTVKLYIF